MALVLFLIFTSWSLFVQRFVSTPTTYTLTESSPTTSKKQISALHSAAKAIKGPRRLLWQLLYASTQH